MAGRDVKKAEGKGGGYLWDEEPPPPGPRPLLSRQKVVEAAIAKADTEGVDAVSMRRLATGLGVGTMTLYRYVPSKDDLLVLMNDAVLGEDEPPDRPSGDWRADLMRVMRLQRSVARRHPWWVETAVGRPPIGPNALRINEFALGALARFDLDIAVMQALVALLKSYVLGAVTSELAEESVVRESGADAEERRESLVPWARRLVAEGRHPLTVRYMAEAEGWDGDRTFQFGADRVLDGIAAMLPDVDVKSG
ncbi:TetR/AcrR family transcriptional regulator [Actinomadura terrae]|uniref:TetR/AcrR family transcriptional regulator n=1 Tax=Actinomadura terrae TaxID=604353 RepID=UPI001FA7F680|nr:TetR/AcrR family transcriptional regulator C-terminal domain-containing protein [Actinomadura terrae]